MRVLDLDMDYFMKSVATFIDESKPERLSKEDYGDDVWTEQEVRSFLEKFLVLSLIEGDMGVLLDALFDETGGNIGFCFQLRKLTVKDRGIEALE